jgi:hypothetical protein
MFQKALFKKLKKDEPLDVVIYNDGRTFISTSQKPTFTQTTLFKFFEKGLKKGAWNNMKPGQYKFHFVEIGPKDVQADLTSVEEYRSKRP